MHNTNILRNYLIPNIPKRITVFQVQQKAAELHRKRTDLFNQISDLTQKQEYLICNDPGGAIRPSPTGVVGAEPVPSRKDKVCLHYASQLHIIRHGISKNFNFKM